MVATLAILVGAYEVHAGPVASFQGLGDLPGGSVFSLAQGVSADGSVVAGISESSTSTPGWEAFRWSVCDGMGGLGYLPGSIFNSSANGISADGSTIVGVSDSASGPEAFRWTAAGGMVGLGDLPGGTFFSIANG
ncbi:MAG: HAF repeat/PEP-CTERM domain-containing protein, partial [bacterium]|nr:HAF repeat/PEP-CTERM domain-containing protein [bacterium]